MKKITFKNDSYFLSDVDIYYIPRKNYPNVIDLLVIYDTESTGLFTVWYVDISLNEINETNIYNWLVSENAIDNGFSEQFTLEELPQVIKEFEIWSDK